MDKGETLLLTNELISRRYLVERNKLEGLFEYLSVPDYIVLHVMEGIQSSQEIYGDRTYLKDLAEKMQLSIHRTSQIARRLRDRGLISWSHDDNGSEGTYISMTDSARELLEKQKEKIREDFGQVIERFGRDNLIELLQLLKRLDTVIGGEFEEVNEELEEGE